jgi:hypothetical protein
MGFEEIEEQTDVVAAGIVVAVESKQRLDQRESCSTSPSRQAVNSTVPGIRQRSS